MMTSEEQGEHGDVAQLAEQAALTRPVAVRARPSPPGERRREEA